MINKNAVVLSESKTRKIVWTLLCVMPVLGMTVDLIAPSLPAIATGLKISPSMAKNVISVYLLGYALGNFFTGFLTDALGRKKLLTGGLGGFLIASLLPVFFPDITVLLLARFLQGVTIGGVSVVSRAVFSDVLPPEKLVRLGVLVGTMWGLGPVIGPLIGGYLQVYFGWQAGFGFFAVISLLLLISVFIIVPETHFNRHPLRITTMKKNFLEVISHRLFLGLVILMGLTYSLIIVFNTAGPFIIQSKLHYSPVVFGRLALILGLVFLISTLVCRYSLKRFEMEQLLYITVNLFLAIAAVVMIISYFLPYSVSLITIGSAMMFFGTGFIFPMSMGKGISLFRHIAGTATATMYLINVLITGLTSFVVSLLNIHSAISLMWLYFTLMLIVAGVYWLMIRPSSTI
jgi:Bcr/CflA subfamily drug resistance transporter